MGWSPTPDLLLQRLQTLGLDGLTVIETHTNRSVMVSRSPSGALRLHQGYAHAPDRVLAAIVRFLRPRGRRALEIRELFNSPGRLFCASSR